MEKTVEHSRSSSLLGWWSLGAVFVASALASTTWLLLEGPSAELNLANMVLTFVIAVSGGLWFDIVRNGSSDVWWESVRARATAVTMGGLCAILAGVRTVYLPHVWAAPNSIGTTIFLLSINALLLLMALFSLIPGLAGFLLPADLRLIEEAEVAPTKDSDDNVYRRLAITHAHTALVSLERAIHFAEKAEPGYSDLNIGLSNAQDTLSKIPALAKFVQSLGSSTEDQA